MYLLRKKNLPSQFLLKLSRDKGQDLSTNFKNQFEIMQTKVSSLRRSMEQKWEKIISDEDGDGD